MASEEKFTDRCFGVIVRAGGAGEQVGVATADGARGEPHCCGCQIHRLIQDADVFQDQGVGDCGVLPSKSPKPCRQNQQDLQILGGDTGSLAGSAQECRDLGSPTGQPTEPVLLGVV